MVQSFPEVERATGALLSGELVRIGYQLQKDGSAKLTECMNCYRSRSHLAHEETLGWGSGECEGVGVYLVLAVEMWVSKGDGMCKSTTLTFPTGPRRGGGPRFWLRRGWGRLLCLPLTRSLLDSPPSWTSRLRKGRRGSKRAMETCVTSENYKGDLDEQTH